VPAGVAHRARPALDEEQVPVALGREEGGEVVLGRRQQPAHVALAVVELGDDGEALVEPVGDQREEELVLAGEARVDGALGQAGRRGDLLDRGGVEAARAEDLASGFEDARPRLRAGGARSGSAAQPWASASARRRSTTRRGGSASPAGSSGSRASGVSYFWMIFTPVGLLSRVLNL